MRIKNLIDNKLGLKFKMDEVELTGLLSTPDLGQGDKEKIEGTDLSDHSRRYINGLADTPENNLRM